MTNPAVVLERFRYLLQSHQVLQALELVNALTDYRFSAIYRFTTSGAANLVIFDREGATPTSLLVVPEGASYCGIVRETRDAFLVTRSLEDKRVFDHPARDAVQSYCGVPLVDTDGNVFGTLCHFDFEPHDAVPAMPDLMHEVAFYLSPDTGLSELAETIGRSISRLAEMGDLLHAVSPNAADLEENVEVYAQPVRLQAQALQPTVRRAMELRLADVMASLLVPRLETN
jgi:GAF domain-containing protein